MGPTAQIKAFIDRWYAVPKEAFRGKRIILTVSSGGGGIYADLMLRMFRDIITYLDMEEFRVIQASGSNTKTSARGNTHIMKEAYSAGLDVVNTLSS